LNFDGHVKSPPSRHSREGGSPESLEKTGFPLPACAGTGFIRGNDRKRRFVTFCEFIIIEHSALNKDTVSMNLHNEKN
jgi:hypothetical protein